MILLPTALAVTFIVAAWVFMHALHELRDEVDDA